MGLYGPILNLGAVGVICVVLFLFARTTVADLRKQRDECQEQVEAKDALLREQAKAHSAETVALLNTVLPLVTQANSVITEALAEMRRIREVR